jgi:hypothetical protein
MGAGLDRATIDVHRASTAVAGLTTDVRAGQVEFFAQKVNQQGAGLYSTLFFFAVDGNGDEFFRHRGFSGL